MSSLLSSFWQVADVWATSFGWASLVACVAIAAAWAIARWCTFLSPRVVCWVWRLACLKVLLSLVSVQPVDVALLPTRAKGVADSDVVSQLAIESKPPASTIVTQDLQQTMLRDRALPLFRLAKGLLLPAWLMGMVYFVFRTGRQRSSASRLCSSSQICASDRLPRMLQEEGQRLGVRRLPDLRISSRVESPLLIGLWRPAIILPDRAEEKFDESELRLMLAHELAHLARHDLAWNWLPTVAAWIFFFHPLVWLMTRRWSEAQEAACDEVVIQRHVAQPADYGRLLLKLSACSPFESSAALGAAGVLGAYRNLERRILAMTRVKPFSARRLLAAACLLLVAALVTIIPWRLVAAEPKEAAAPKVTATWGPNPQEAPKVTATFIRKRPQEPKEGSDPATLKALARLKELGATPAEIQGEGLSLGFQRGWKGTADDLNTIAELSPLKFLYFDLDQISAVDVGKLMPQLKGRIEFLGLESLSDKRLTALTHLPACRILMLGQETLSAAGFRHLAEMNTGVESLQLRGEAEDDSLVAIGQIRSLKELQLQQAKITDAGLAHLAGLDHLDKLLFFECRGIRGRGYASLAPMKLLRQLMVLGPQIDAQMTEALSKLTQLDTLSLTPNRLPPDGLKVADVQALKHLNKLRIFSVMCQSPASDAAKQATGAAILAVAGQLPSLRQLSVIGVTADADALAALSKASQLEELRLFDVTLSARLLAALGALTNLKQLDLSSQGGVTDALWPKLTGLTQLTGISLQGSGLNDANLAQLADLTALERLDLPNSNVTGTGLKALTSLKQLKRLTLSESPFSDEGAEALRELPTIEWLILSKTKITDHALDAIATLPQLFVLNLDDTAVTVDGLMKLRDLKKLSSLSVVGVGLSDEELAKLHAAMPDVQISNEGVFYNYGATPTATKSDE